ncbi:GTP-binding protein lepa [Pavlovales sp. CCMP2436]|nr:GTP-binding protein lepa [Pavlovales sp. CCMP2436]
MTRRLLALGCLLALADGLGAPLRPHTQRSHARASRLRMTSTQAAKQKPAPDARTDYIVPVEQIRNFCIIAHIDHGKSTLADRLIQLTGTVSDREMKSQLLDSMDIERERGITIKLQAARMVYLAADGKEYILNLIDTPGHVDFGYEVARSLQACEGALLVVDASQGVEAQTIANVFLALEQDLELIPVINKVDLPAADVDRTAAEVEACIGLDCTEAIACSAKSGLNIAPILEAIVLRIPPPEATREKPLRALVFDSYYDAYRGVVVFVRIVDGSVRKGDKLRFMATKFETDCLEVGVMSPGQRPTASLNGGEVGYITGAIKSISEARVGDTITLAKHANDESVTALPGYREPVPMVYCGLYPTEGDDYPKLRDSIEKLKTNDAALVFEPDVSSAMGFGFRCGFLGLLHMEIVQERLEREYDLDLIVTAPSVVYKVNTTRGEEIIVDTPSRMPDPTIIATVSEPYVALELYSPKDYSGTLMELCQGRRGEYKDLTFVTPDRVSLKYDLPLSECEMLEVQP